jgi:hypothetical protein
VAQHGALGRARGAGRVDENREVSRLRDLDHRIEGARVLPVVPVTERQELLERHHLRIREAVQPFHVEDDDPDELRAALPDLQDLVELLLVLGEEEACAAIVDDVLDLACRVGRVDAVGDAADRHRAEVRVEPLGAVLGDDGHHVPRLEAQGDEPEPDLLRAQAVLAPRDRAPDAEMLLAHGRGVAALLTT